MRKGSTTRERRAKTWSGGFKKGSNNSNDNQRISFFSRFEILVVAVGHGIWSQKLFSLFPFSLLFQSQIYKSVTEQPLLLFDLLNKWALLRYSSTRAESSQILFSQRKIRICRTLQIQRPVGTNWSIYTLLLRSVLLRIWTGKSQSLPAFVSTFFENTSAFGEKLQQQLGQLHWKSLFLFCWQKV